MQSLSKHAKPRVRVEFRKPLNKVNSRYSVLKTYFTVGIDDVSFLLLPGKMRIRHVYPKQ